MNYIDIIVTVTGDRGSEMVFLKTLSNISYLYVFLLCVSLCCSDDGSSSQGALIADHSVAALSVLQSIPSSDIRRAKSDLHIAYGHTSHGSQIITGMDGLVAFMNALGYEINLYSGLDLHDYYGNFGGSGVSDLGNPDRTSWAQATRNYLNANPEINVIVWSWCGQVSSATDGDIETYLTLMKGLEAEFPGVHFVYMTGHLDGTGVSGNLHLRNEQIREYCRANNKILFDFADIETYNPDGVYFGNLNPNDACDYSGGNWATEWQSTHVVNSEWYSCSSAHSQPLNANMKAYAFWWLLARLAGGGG